jgi:hypothetical protein
VCVSKEPHLERRVAGYASIGWDDARTGRRDGCLQLGCKTREDADESLTGSVKAGVGDVFGRRDGSSRGRKRRKFAAYRRQPSTYPDQPKSRSSARIWPLGTKWATGDNCGDGGRA